AALGPGLEEARTLASPRALDGVARRLVDREHVAAVHASPRNPVAHSLVGQRSRRGLRRERCRDRPLVVIAEENERRAHDGREVRALVKRALGGRAVAEVADRASALAAKLLAPGEPGRVRYVSRDRDADRGDVP